MSVRATTARCPSGHQRSRRVPSRYTRRIADEPIGGRRLTIHLQVRRFRCGVRRCRQQTFAEQAPALTAREARRSGPLQARLQDLGVTLGGRPGVRLARRRQLVTSRTTLLRLVRGLPEPASAVPVVLGVDDFAVRRGHRYGTLLVDLEARRPSELLQDRTAATFAAWLQHQERPTLICRDRGGAYAAGARQGAPEAIQIADRFHLSRHRAEVLERIVARHPAARRAAVAESTSTSGPDQAARAQVTPTDVSASLAPAVPSAAVDPRRERRRARSETVVALRQQGWSMAAIGQRVGLSQPTVSKYLRTDTFPEWAARRTRLSAGTAPATHLQTRWAEGGHNAKVLWQELRARGFPGTLRQGQRAVADWREAPRRRRHPAPLATPAGQPVPRPLRPPSSRQAVWLLLRPGTQLAPAEPLMRHRLLAAAPTVQAALTVVEAFRALVRTRDRTALRPWFESAEACSVPEIRGLAASLRRDQAAVEAALSYPWSSGQVEGQVTKLKLIKRQMDGRAKFDLLRKRVLLAS
ncbi:MAG: ISL3 family transposase [Chloroflexi bacterium]|nr:ISL3 family transposase [Chloroflexota bacterium]